MKECALRRDEDLSDVIDDVEDVVEVRTIDTYVPMNIDKVPEDKVDSVKALIIMLKTVLIAFMQSPVDVRLAKTDTGVDIVLFVSKNVFGNWAKSIPLSLVEDKYQEDPMSIVFGLLRVETIDRLHAALLGISCFAEDGCKVMEGSEHLVHVLVDSFLNEGLVSIAQDTLSDAPCSGDCSFGFDEKEIPKA